MMNYNTVENQCTNAMLVLTVVILLLTMALIWLLFSILRIPRNVHVYVFPDFLGM